MLEVEKPKREPGPNDNRWSVGRAAQWTARLTIVLPVRVTSVSYARPYEVEKHGLWPALARVTRAVLKKCEAASA